MIEKFDFMPGESDGRSESEHQIDCASFIDCWYPHLNFFHVANESGSRGKVQFIVKRAKMGVKKGVADMIILSKTNQGHPYAAIELKSPAKGKRVSKEQASFLESVDADGGLAVTCWGHLAFRRVLEKYYK